MPAQNQRPWPGSGGPTQFTTTHWSVVLAAADNSSPDAQSALEQLCLLSLHSPMSIANALQFLNGSSSKWQHDNFPEHRLFGWQVKYAAFSVSFSQ